jgi:cytosine/adenosine deaminase-related metal-dependent hydrolase
MDHLWELSFADRALVIHGNYLDDDELAFLAARSERMAVVYCPRTHDFFGHRRYPLEKALAAGVNVAIGTDSRASNPDLSVLAELRFVAAHYPEVPRDTILRLGTLSGARALGLGRIGCLEAGAFADLTVVRLPQREAVDPHDLVLESDLPVVATWFRGEQVFSAG